MNTQRKAKMDSPSAHHPTVVLWKERETIDNTAPTNANPHPPQPQHAPPMKLHAAATAAKQIATIPIVRAVLSFSEEAIVCALLECLKCSECVLETGADLSRQR